MSITSILTSLKSKVTLEYIIIVAAIFIAVMTVSKTLGGHIQDTVTKSSCLLVDKVYVSGSRIGEGYCSSK